MIKSSKKKEKKLVLMKKNIVDFIIVFFFLVFLVFSNDISRPLYLSCNSIKKNRLWGVDFPANHVEFYRTAFLQNS